MYPIVLLACTPTPPDVQALAPVEHVQTPEIARPPADTLPPLPSLPDPQSAAPLQVWLSDLVPPPPPSDPDYPVTTAALHHRVLPPGGVRERRAGVEVRGTCDDGTCQDRLADADHRRDFVTPDLDLAEDTWVQSAIRLVSVDETYVSAWFGTTRYTAGAAHAVNSLTCATWSRSTRARLRLSDVLGEAEASRRLSSALAARRLLAADFQVSSKEADMLATVNVSTDTILVDEQGAVFVCTEAIYAEHGSVWVWPLGRTTTAP